VALANTFNWSALTRDMLYSLLNEVQSRVVGKKLTIEKFQKIVSQHLKGHLPIRVVCDRDPETESEYVFVGGWYFSDLDKKHRKPIQVVFSYHFFDEFIQVSRHKWQRICWLFADTMLHEIIHMRQFRARKFKSIPGYQSTASRGRDRRNQNYYGDKDEIGAYSFNIACELLDRFGSDFCQMKAYIDSDQYRRHKRTTFYKYMKSFDWNHNHPIIRKIKKKSLSYIPNAQIGKPFRTTDYLTY